METIPPAEFEGDRLRRPGRVVVAFVADWCPYCRAFLPHFEAWSKEASVPFALGNVSDEESPLWDTFQIKIVPTVVAFEDGKIAWRVDGRWARGISEKEFRRGFAPWSAAPPA